jgi:hypothetical protein
MPNANQLAVQVRRDIERSASQGHALAMLEGASVRELQDERLPLGAWVAGLHYLAAQVVEGRVSSGAFARKHKVELHLLLAAAQRLRDWLGYRRHVAQWIRGGQQDLTPAPPPFIVQSVRPIERAAAAPPVATPSFSSRVTAGLSKLRSWRGWSSDESRSSWTGTQGTVSYYDKDSSPD